MKVEVEKIERTEIVLTKYEQDTLRTAADIVKNLMGLMENRGLRTIDTPRYMLVPDDLTPIYYTLQELASKITHKETITEEMPR